MSRQEPKSNEQGALWNGLGGQSWVASQDLLDDLFRPIEDLLVDSAVSVKPHHVLDVGCGTGSTTIALALRLGGSGACTGVDISEPMISRARERASLEDVAVTYVRADAQTYPFDRASFDLLISRFGVMFFDDPVEALANLRRAAAPGAAVRFIAWRGAAENPFMTTAEHAAAPLLPQLPSRRPNEPGQFAFADRDRVREIPQNGGWHAVGIEPIDVPCTMPEGALVRYVSQLGPVGRALQQADDECRARVIAAVRPAFTPYVLGGEVRFAAACWMMEARA
ncbi:MAG: methyltransferase domain-containing protein [Myxococcales bacterium]|nr:methyltransferase domain-containing protein [Myxococcales bacterium]